MRAQSTVQLVASLAALGLAWPGGLPAQDDFFLDDEEEELIEIHENFVEVGVGYQDDGTRHWGRDSGLTGTGFSPLLDFRLRVIPEWDGDSTLYWRLEGYRMGWDSRRFEMEVGQQGTQRFGLSWREMPRHRIEGALSPYNGLGSTFLGAPPGWEATASSTAAMPRLFDDLNSFNLKTHRDRLDLNYWRSFTDRLNMNIDYRRETKEGTRAGGAIFGFTGGNPRGARVPFPVDFETDIVDVSFEFSGEKYMVGAGYHGSFFQNHKESLSFQNLFGQHPQWAPGVGFPDGIGRLSLAPDNRFNQIRGFGSFRFSPRTHFNADVALGRMEQDEAFLPFTVNPRIDAPVPVPLEDLNGRIDTTLINLRMTTRPADRLNLVLSWRFDDRDNKSDQAAFQLIGADAELQKSPDNARINLPYSFREHVLKAEGTWRLARRTRLVGGVHYMEQERDNFAEAADLDEWAVWGGFRTSFRHDFSFSADILYADREFDEYDGRAPFIAGHVPGTVGPDEFENHPNLRKFNVADRERLQLKGRLDYMPVQTVNIGLAAHYTDDDYDDERFGLTAATVESWMADFGYFPTGHLSLSAFYALERYEAEQAGRDWPGNVPALAFDPNRNWFVDHDDRIDTFGATLEVTDIAPWLNGAVRTGLEGRLDLGFDALFVRTRAEFDIRTGPSLTTEPLPDAVTRLNAYGVWARYRFTTNWHVRFGIEHERFDSSDFAIDGVEIDTLSNLLLLGQTSPSYNVTWFTALLGYRF